MANVDFAELKARVSIADVLSMLKVTNLRNSGGALRGPCPICGGDATDRHFIVTPGKGWYCHGTCKNGGDIIKLVATVRQIDVRTAALAIQEHFGGTVHGATVHRTKCTVPEGNRSGPQLQQILERLQPEHEAVQKLGVSPQTASDFESGFERAGLLRGRYSVTLRDLRGTLTGFVGIPVAPDQSPRLKFPEAIDPATILFNAHRVTQGGDLFVCRTPLGAILAVENGAPIESVVAFATPLVSAQQWEMLAGFMDEHQIEGSAL
jgi:hypothetical protein